MPLPLLIDLIICASIFTLSISAQSVDEGNILIGASSDLNATIVIPKGEDVDVDDMILHANVYCGYFLIDNFVAGFNLDYMGVDGEFILGYGLFSRYYIDGEIYCHLVLFQSLFCGNLHRLGG